MNDRQIRAIEHIEQKIAKLGKLKAAIGSLPELNVNTLYESCEQICMSIPYDPSRIAEVRNALGATWQQSVAPHILDSSGDWFGEYELKADPDVTITVIGEINVTGATCKRVKSGERTVNVYKIVCGDELVPA